MDSASKTRFLDVFFLTSILLSLPLCGGGSGAGISFEGTIEGTIAGTNDTEGQSGTMSVTVPAAVADSSLFSLIRTSHALVLDSITGTLNLAGGGSITLTGTFDDSTGDLNLSGEGGYTFSGTIDDDGLMSGSYDSTDDDTGGGFAGLDSTTDTVQVFCGTFINGSGGSSGLFNLVVTDSTVSGVRINYSSRSTYRTLSGTRTGDNIYVVVDDNGRRGTGVITGDDVEGTFENAEGNPGSYTGSVSECL